MKTQRTKKITTTRSDLLLYLLCVLIWGSTWIVIKFQVDAASPLIGVFYRFIISTGILFLLHFFLKKTLKYSRKHHLFFFLQGVTNFSLNYVLTYQAEVYSPSAIIALTFTMLVHFNIFGTWFFFKKPIDKYVLMGAGLGAIGIFLLFFEDLQKMDLNPMATWGIVLGIIGTISASAGNLFAYKNHLMKVPVMASSAWAMLYGLLFTGFLCLIFNESFVFPTTIKFWSAMLYLSVVGTVIAFLAYLTLIGRIGTERASYTTVATPVIAVTISAFVENLQITYFLVAGMIFCLLGNVLTLYGRSPSKVPEKLIP
jgi:drug/metabolite transporter (DMT)-like permease